MSRAPSNRRHPGRSGLAGLSIEACIVSGAILMSCVLWSAKGSAEESLSDPTRPPVSVEVSLTPESKDQASALALQAIFFAAGRRVAIINDLRVQEQDVVGAARIVRIDRDRVLLIRGAEPLELRLVSHDLKQPRHPSTPFPEREPPPSSISLPVAPAAIAPTSAIDEIGPVETQQGSRP